eukprot:365450-Chlamydomonas_euryale.AAC.4
MEYERASRSSGSTNRCCHALRFKTRQKRQASAPTAAPRGAASGPGATRPLTSHSCCSSAPHACSSCWCCW